MHWQIATPSTPVHDITVQFMNIHVHTYPTSGNLLMPTLRPGFSGLLQGINDESIRKYRYYTSWMIIIKIADYETLNHCAIQYLCINATVREVHTQVCIDNQTILCTITCNSDGCCTYSGCSVLATVSWNITRCYNCFHLTWNILHSVE